MVSEIWKSVKGFEGIYEISNFGRVKSLERKWQPRERILKSYFKSRIYNMVVLHYTNNEQKQIRIHRLVALHFIPNPENKREVNHLDGNKRNNNVENLEWATALENMRHAYKNGLMENSGSKRKKVIQISKIGKVIKVWKSTASVERHLKIDRGSITKCCKNKAKTAGKFKWEYF